jgi:hypothetical protein
VRRTALRVLAFALALGAVFAAALGIGAAAGPISRGGGDEPAHAEEAPAAVAVPGLAVAADGFRLVAARTRLTPLRRQSLAFRVVGAEGAPQREYDLTHERRMHLIVVRRDLSRFLHLHPELGADGSWRATVPPLEPGAYRAFADFAVAGRKTTLGIDLGVPGTWSPRPLPRPSTRAVAGPYTVALDAPDVRAGEESTLGFRVTRAGRPVAVDRYLGARGHLVLLREGDLGYLHTHADEERLEFGADFPSAGRYAAFLQLSVGGAVRTAAFTLEVTR